MTTLPSNAEQLADKARELPAFKNFSLPGVKQRVTTILAMIGRVKGIFSTYTIHDISHVDEMLKMLDWLIPQETKSKMTPPDWLLVVLAAYLHDLGMVVAEEEYTARHENPRFEDFLSNIKTDPENKDYLDRVDKFDTDDEKETFFFQEYIRLHHASRVREWINGRHSTQWGDKAKVIAEEINSLLATLPKRFRENLADICASHHSNDLDKTEYFPLTQRYGSHPEEVANIQYAAILLRTIDLLHITKDRTPSIMYKIIKMSDPKGVDEWAKQNETFSVNMKYREFDLNNTETHIIVISADFSEERGYFPLSEYMAYANAQLEQSRRWADASQKTNDGKNYLFPWHTIQGDIRVEGNDPVQMRFDLDRGRLLDLLVGHTIYNDPTVAVRELLQNAIDAVRYQYYLDQKSLRPNQQAPEIGNVEIKWDSERRELIIEDHGVGMNLDVITFNLMRVGASFYNTPKFHSEFVDFTPISRFGIGILTCFMVSDNIEITTCQEDSGYRIKMTSVQSDYLIKKLEGGNPVLQGIEPHGTRVKLQLRKSIDLTNRTMLDIVRHWIILPPCPVTFQANNQTPVQIGFDTPKNALRHFYAQGEGAPLKDEADFDIIEATASHEGEIYKLAFAVNKGFTPERNFKLVPRYIDPPAVCIEGIRASSTFPGFASDQRQFENMNICGILSVQGNKKFRTTVSRMDLEMDDEYIKVSELCGRMFFDHIESEIARISDQPNRPLSQASSAGSWMYNRLARLVNTKQLATSLDKLYRSLSLIVVETVKSTHDKPITSRELLSQEKLKKIETFWTIESRLVDYLGIISRDMGRELSLNDFLATLAPDFRDPRIHTVLPDAEKFSSEIIQSHSATSVEYSRKYQQSIIEWNLKDQHVNNYLTEPSMLSEHLEEGIYRLMLEAGGFTGGDRDEIVRSIIRTSLNYVMLAPIAGDLSNISLVNTRIVMVIDPKSALGDVLIYLSSIHRSLEDEINREDDIIKIIGGMKLLIAASNADPRYFLRRRVSPYVNESSYSPLWKSVCEKINGVLEKTNNKRELSDRLTDFVCESKNYFDASQYWMDWSRGGSEQDY